MQRNYLTGCHRSANYRLCLLPLLNAGQRALAADRGMRLAARICAIGDPVGLDLFHAAARRQAWVRALGTSEQGARS
jgi:hypothetical protein